MKLSVITPCKNAGSTLERAIQSVLSQSVLSVEHIVVDGGSHDGTIEILKKYSHLRWISETDRGQVHAMNKGFAMATGDIIVYLNADDYFAPKAFTTAMSAFTPAVDMVMGNVAVRKEVDGLIHGGLSTPRYDFNSVLRHWESHAFCVNPVGYFYRRKVQEAIPFEEKYDAKMDLAFLLEVARQGFLIKKIDAILGVFEFAENTRTAQELKEPDYWMEDNFPFITEAARNLPKKEQELFFTARKIAYCRLRESCIGESVHTVLSPVQNSRRLGVLTRLVLALYRAPLATLRNIADFSFIWNSKLFWEDYYIATQVDVREGGIDPFAHFLACTRSEGRMPNPCFEPAWYCAMNPDVWQSAINPLRHFITHGAAEGRAPSPLFDFENYRTNNPELVGMDAFRQYLRQYSKKYSEDKNNAS